MVSESCGHLYKFNRQPVTSDIPQGSALGQDCKMLMICAVGQTEPQQVFRLCQLMGESTVDVLEGCFAALRKFDRPEKWENAMSHTQVGISLCNWLEGSFVEKDLGVLGRQ